MGGGQEVKNTARELEIEWRYTRRNWTAGGRERCGWRATGKYEREREGEEEL